MSRTNGMTVAALICSVALSATAMPAAENSTPKRPTVLYSIGIKGMTCETCSAHAQKGLAAVPGVIKASVDYKAGHAWVTVETPRATAESTTRPRNIPAEFAAAIDRVGYKPNVHYVVTVKGMTCEACAQHISADLCKVRGVAGASVNFKGGYAVVMPEDKAGDLTKPVLTAIEQAGYKPVIQSGPQPVEVARKP